MPARLARFRALAAVILAIGAVSFSQAENTSLPLITPVQAVHLVEAELRGLSIQKTELNGSQYTVDGTQDGAPVSALVDGTVARVLRIEKAGLPIFEWKGITTVGHRGNVKFAPENTIAAFNKAIELGADLVEMDVRETKDGHLVVIHDAMINRTTNGSGAVHNLTLAEIKALDAGSWFDEKFAGERVPTFKEALDAIKGRALPDIDFKAGTPEKMVAAVREAGLLGKCTLYCGNHDLLRRTLEVSNEFIIRPTSPRGTIGLNKLLLDFNPPVVNMDWPYFTEPFVREIHLAGKKAFVNTMGASDNEFAMQKAIEAGADYIQTDNLDVLMPLLRERGLHK